MIELPEAYVLASQINNTLKGRIIRRAEANAHPHPSAVFSGDPAQYHGALAGKRVMAAAPRTGNTGGSQVEIVCEDRSLIIGAPIKYHPPGEKPPLKHQLLIEFDDSSFISCTIQMWGVILCVPAAREARDTREARGEGSEDGESGDSGDGGYGVAGGAGSKAPTPLDDRFDLDYFLRLIHNANASLSVKAFLTADQRIPGLGNGVMHDILFNARIHPKRKIETFSEYNEERFFHSIKSTLRYMTERGGRDTERDFFGNPGGYKTILSSRTCAMPCRACGGPISKEAYLGGNIYYCPECQPLTA